MKLVLLGGAVIGVAAAIFLVYSLTKGSGGGGSGSSGGSGGGGRPVDPTCPSALAEDVQRVVAAVALPSVPDPRGTLAKAVAEFETFNRSITSRSSSIALIVARNVAAAKAAQDKAAAVNAFRRGTEFNNTHHYLALLANIHAAAQLAAAPAAELEANKQSLERALKLARDSGCDQKTVEAVEQKMRENTGLLNLSEGYRADVDKALSAVVVRWPIDGKVTQVPLKTLYDDQRELVEIARRALDAEKPLSMTPIYFGAVVAGFLLLLLVTFLVSNRKGTGPALISQTSPVSISSPQLRKRRDNL